MYFPRIRDVREDRDKRQKEIAVLLYISQQQYSLYERGEREMPVSYLYTSQNSTVSAPTIFSGSQIG